MKLLIKSILVVSLSFGMMFMFSSNINASSLSYRNKGKNHEQNHEQNKNNCDGINLGKQIGSKVAAEFNKGKHNNNNETRMRRNNQTGYRN